MLEAHLRRLLLVLWVAGALLFVILWIAGLGWGIHPGFKTWTWFALPLFLITEVAASRLRSGGWVVLAVWVGLLGVGGIGPDLAGHRSPSLAKGAVLIVSVLTTGFPVWVIIRAFRHVLTAPLLSARRRSFAIMAALAGYVLSMSWVAYHQLRRPEQVVVYFRPEASAEDVELLWQTALSRDADRMPGTDLIPGIEGVTAGSDDGYRTLTVTFSPRTRAEDKQHIVERLRQSPGVLRTDHR